MHFLTFLQVLFLLDADFMISSSLNELQHNGWVHSVVSQGVLVVVPAFEPVSNDLTSQQAVIRSCTGGSLLLARYNIQLFIKLTPKGVVFSFLFTGGSWLSAAAAGTHWFYA